jgi:ATP-binding cassette subfamily B protein
VSSALSIVQEVLTGLRLVKAFGQEEREHERFVTRSGEGMQARIRLAAVEGAFTFAIGMTTTLGIAAVLYLGVKHVESGRLTLGSLLLVMGYLTQLYLPLRQISGSINSLQGSLASAERAFAILDRNPDVSQAAHPRSLGRAAGAVCFEGVWFAYQEEPVLRGVSFRVEPGVRVGISGATGAGKTTLVNLLTRFDDPDVGRILLDGVDLREYKVADLRNQFAIVLQEPVLFSRSIAENIAYARPEATFVDVVAAARAANADGFIRALPDGYDTLVGERGMRLSGGERQRVSLARAFLKDAPILILDEPTSSVDVRTETAIMEAMERLISGKTTFMIAHRLSTLEGCDLRLELEAGGIVNSQVVGPERRGSAAWHAAAPDRR